jgi:parallel beta-helix repeat protein
MRVGCLVVVLSLIAGHARAGTWYVATDGDDHATGAANAPWRTLQHAASAVKPGDTVVVAPGNYAGFVMGWDGGQAGAEGLPIRFIGRPGATIVSRNSATADGINLEGASYVVIQGFTINNARGTIDRAGIRSVQNRDVIIRDNIVENCGTWDIFTGFSDRVLIENNVASGARRQHGIYVSNSSDYPTIRGNKVFGNWDCGIHLNGDATQGGKGFIAFALVENNVIHDNGADGGSGINCDGVRDSRIQNNLLYRNHAGGITLFRINGKGGSTDNVIVNNTIVMPPDGRWAIHIMDGSSGNTVYNNILYNHNTDHGSIDISDDSLKGFFSDYNVTDGRFSFTDGPKADLPAWRKGTGQDEHSAAVRLQDLFVDPDRGDYRPSAISAAIGAGISLAAPRQAPTTDLNGAKRIGMAWDVGAYLPTNLRPAKVMPDLPKSRPSTRTAAQTRPASRPE